MLYLTVFFHGNNGYANALLCYFYTCVARLVNLWHKTDMWGSAAHPENFTIQRAHPKHWTVGAVESRAVMITAVGGTANLPEIEPGLSGPSARTLATVLMDHTNHCLSYILKETR